MIKWATFYALTRFPPPLKEEVHFAGIIQFSIAVFQKYVCCVCDSNSKLFFKCAKTPFISNLVQKPGQPVT